LGFGEQKCRSSSWPHSQKRIGGMACNLYHALKRAIEVITLTCVGFVRLSTLSRPDTVQ